MYRNFGKNFPSNRTSCLVFFGGTEDRNGIELYHLQNTGKFFAFARHEAWHYNPIKWYRNFGRFGKNGKKVIPRKVLHFFPGKLPPGRTVLNSPRRNFRVFHTNGKRSCVQLCGKPQVAFLFAVL